MRRAWSLLAALAALALGGCASVKVIAPVAAQGERNAKALDENLRRHFEETDALVTAAVELILIDLKTDIIRSAAQDKPDETSGDTIKSFYTTEAAKLVAEVAAKTTDDAKLAIIAEYRVTRPITAAVAFDNLTAEAAAGKWQALRAIRAIPAAAGVDKFEQYARVVDDLAVVQQANAARDDIFAGHARLRGAILTQSANGVTISRELFSASQTGADPGAFLKGVTENTELIGTIAQGVERFSHDDKRVAAARKLLESLKNAKNITNASQ